MEIATTGTQEDTPGLKTCPRCGREDLLVTDFYLATKTNAPAGTPRRRMHWCKECHKKYSTQRRRNRLASEGQSYRDAENKRVRSYMSQEQVADKRRATERAKQAAMRELRIRHAKEYMALLKAAKAVEGLRA